MKKFASYCFIWSILLSFMACSKEETMTYEGTDGLYFDIQYGAEHGNENVWAHQFYSYVGFGSIDTTIYTLPLRIKAVGRVVDYDRPFQIEIVSDSTTAEQNVEFEFEPNQVIKAGEMQTNLICKLFRTERLMDTTLQIQFRIIGGEHFQLPFSEIGRIPGRWDDAASTYGQNHNPGIHNVFINNLLNQPPGTCWGANTPTGPFGIYSQKKYQMLLDVSGYSQEDFNNSAKMQAGLRNIILRKATDYLMGEYNKGREYWVLDEDGTMMYVQGVTWAQGTNPDDMADVQ